MTQSKSLKLRKTARTYIRLAAYALLGASIGGLLMLHVYPRLSATENTVEPTEGESFTHTLMVGGSSDEHASLPRSLPMRIRVPSLNLDARFEEPLMLHEDGTITVPNEFNTVGWYQGGASPGENGTASILGHVDSYEGPAVFYAIGQLTPGDVIRIDREDGTTAEFTVEYLERYEQDEFPTEMVYGMTDYPSLRLITCSGVYDRESSRYSHNTVVYARLTTNNRAE